jgi:hypothetical protein
VDPGERAWSGAVLFLSRDLGGAIYLQQAHDDDGAGWCRGCRAQMTWSSHPCVARRLADQAVANLIPLQRGSDEP